MSTTVITHPTTIELSFEPNYQLELRKTETMFVKLLRKFFWMNKVKHRHSIHHLSDHLKRDIGRFEKDINNRARPNKQNEPKINYGKLWL